MINFDSVEFSERRPEEVTSFFWRSLSIISHNTHMNIDCIKKL